MKKNFYSELAYILGILLLAMSAAFMTKSDFGLSMVIAPAYIIHLEVSKFLPWFSFGVAAYCVQLVIILVLSAVLRKIKLSFFYSFVTAVIYGYTLDLFIYLIDPLPTDSILLRAVYFVGGMVVCSLGVTFIFHTYLPPEAYELFVKRVSERYNFDIGKTKTVYDCSSCLIAVILSFAFFGFMHFEGVKLGTVVCALLNGSLIGVFSKLLDRIFDFKDRLPLRDFFSK